MSLCEFGHLVLCGISLIGNWGCLWNQAVLLRGWLWNQSKNLFCPRSSSSRFYSRSDWLEEPPLLLDLPSLWSNRFASLWQPRLTSLGNKTANAKTILRSWAMVHSLKSPLGNWYKVGIVIKEALRRLEWIHLKLFKREIFLYQQVTKISLKLTKPICERDREINWKQKT